MAKGEESKAQDMIARLFEYYQKDPDKLRALYDSGYETAKRADGKLAEYLND